MPIGKVRMYRLLFVFVCTVTYFSGEDKTSGVKFCTLVYRRPGQEISHFGELCSPFRGSKPQKTFLGPWIGVGSACVDNLQSLHWWSDGIVLRLPQHNLRSEYVSDVAVCLTLHTWQRLLNSLRCAADVGPLVLQPATTLRTCAGKVTFSDLVLPAAVLCQQPVTDNARTWHLSVIRCC